MFDCCKYQLSWWIKKSIPYIVCHELFKNKTTPSFWNLKYDLLVLEETWDCAIMPQFGLTHLAIQWNNLSQVSTVWIPRLLQVLVCRPQTTHKTQTEDEYDTGNSSWLFASIGPTGFNIILMSSSTTWSLQFNINLAIYILQVELSIISLNMPFISANVFHATQPSTNIKSKILR